MDGGWNDVVAALAQVDMIVRMHRPATEPACQRRDDLVSVHVGAGARSGLKNIQRKLRVVKPLFHLLRRGGNGYGDVVIEQAQFAVDLGRAFLDQAQSREKRAGKSESAEGEILNRALCLRTIERVRGNPHLAQTIV